MNVSVTDNLVLHIHIDLARAISDKFVNKFINRNQ